MKSNNRGKILESDCLKLVESIYLDATSLCSDDVSDFRDLKTIRSRVRDEGLSFLTLTLPEFARDFEKCLEQGHVDSKRFLRFRKCRAIPHFLRGMLSRIFNVETGRIYDQNSCNASDVPSIIKCVRQICLTFKKLELSCSRSREAAALKNFVTIEHSLEMFSLPREEHDYFSRVSSALWGSMLYDLRISDAVSKHGPGATADRISGNRKYDWLSWHERLEPYFPMAGHCYNVVDDSPRMFEAVKLIPEEKEQPVRVTLVPKTLKGPRIIAIEPCCMQYTQQGIRDMLYNVIESHPLTSGRINFSDQTINRNLAMISSVDGLLATIDLSDASDRVPRNLALEMFRSNPDLRDAIDACRSTRAELPDGSILDPILKFASMGSALCFPIEAMYFYTLCVMALLGEHNLPVTCRNLSWVTEQVHIYGDDIIVPSMYADAVLAYLQKYNCKVNRNKTFVSGKFRESCGLDAYDGVDVTPTYVRRLRPENRRQAQQLISWVSTANSFYLKGFWRTSQHMFNCVENILGELPYVSQDSDGLGRVSYLGRRSIGRWNRLLHRFEVKAWVPRPVYRTDKLEGYGALMKSFLKLRDLNDLEASRDAKHLEHSELSGEVAIHRRWVPVT
jgi:hypothetical protein